jgi:hypothetical protein
MLRLPLRTELSAATALAERLGLGVVTPEVLHLGNHTTAKLNPWPIVARIASGTSFDFSHDGLSRELAIATHLAAHEAPSVRPTTEVDPGPHGDGECAVTLWQFIDGRVVTTEDDAFAAAASLKLIHSALRNLDADLPSFIAKVESCKTILRDSAEAPMLTGTDRAFLERLYRSLRRELDGVGGGWQRLHGDTHIGNARIIESGAIWMDLEAACVGPVEWDVVNLPVATWSEFPGIDRALMRLFTDIRSLCVAVWCWAEFDRSQDTAEAATYHLRELRNRFN